MWMGWTWTRCRTLPWPAGRRTRTSTSAWTWRSRDTWRSSPKVQPPWRLPPDRTFWNALEFLVHAGVWRRGLMLAQKMRCEPIFDFLFKHSHHLMMTVWRLKRHDIHDSITPRETLVLLSLINWTKTRILSCTKVLTAVIKCKIYWCKCWTTRRDHENAIPMRRVLKTCSAIDPF